MRAMVLTAPGVPFQLQERDDQSLGLGSGAAVLQP